ncbi:restriction endonuclease subunit S [Lacticaseibacillus paracasei]|uniref:restriction endonuclease subunit S n=1 Tax=Lacticaseibacillus paracasei TaxID=1597 RepID=UPI0036D23346
MDEYTDRVFVDDSKVYNQVSVKNIGEIELRGSAKGSLIGRKRQAKINLDDHPTTLVFTRQTIEQGGIGFAPSTTNGAIVTENMPTISVNVKVFSKSFLSAYFKTSAFRNTVILPNIKGGTAQVAVHESDVLASEIQIPKLDEQNSIGRLCELVDNLIAATQDKIDALEQTKRALLQRLFDQSWRFKGYSGSWEKHKLGDLAKRVRGNDGRMDLPILTISAGNGWLTQKERFSQSIAGNELKNYTLLAKNELSYNHGNSKLAKYGAVFALEKYNEALVPRVYHSFDVSGKADSNFIEYLFSSKTPDHELRKLISSGARMDGLLNINYESFMNISLLFPSIEEQQKISGILEITRKLSSETQLILSRLTQIKKALLQKLFI